MGRRGGKATADLVQRLVELGTDVLGSDLGIEREPAQQAMREIAHQLCQDCGGQNVYVPRDQDYALDARDMQIWNAFTGHNLAELALRHRLSTQQIRNILRHVREQESARRQPALPGFGDTTDGSSGG